MVQKRTLDKISENHRKGNFLRSPSFLFFRDDNCRKKLPYPTHEVKVGEDKCLVYDIPKEKMQEVLDYVNPLKGQITFPIKSRKKVALSSDNKKYCFGSAFIVYYKRHNYIVPPPFFVDGSTAMGWGIRPRKKITTL